MASYTAPLREIEFVLTNVLDVSRLAARIPAFAEATPDTLMGLIGEAAKLIEGQIAPLNASGDLEGCRWLPDGRVKTPTGFPEAYAKFVEGGWVAVSNPPEFDGLGLPYTLSKVIDEMVCSANVGFALYPGLTTGCFEALLAKGTDEQKALYLPKLSTGEWTGTMCLTEPQAGSDLAAVKTRATPAGDGGYRIDGAKIFITSGEHDLAPNIIHFVLARLPDSPPGVKGLSSFVVPKFRVGPGGALGERNRVKCVGIEHKMGMHSSCTCQMLFEGARGWMVGAPNSGIQNMFVMMNLTRILVGLQGLGQCELATQNAIAYARGRTQGRALTGGSGSVAIIEHADVRRMLLTMKATTEGARMLAYETAIHVDFAHHHPDPTVREEASDWVDLNTPLVKSFCTDAAVELGGLAVQVYGGHGFIRDHGVEQILRDSKILCLYEGTNGIQALDLVRRKLMLHGGRLPRRFFDKVRADLDETEETAFITGPLQRALAALELATSWLIESFHDDPDAAGLGAVEYQRAFSLTYLGHNWLRMTRAALALPDPAYRAAKLTTAEFFATRMLSQVPALCDNVRAGCGRLMRLEAANF